MKKHIYKNNIGEYIKHAGKLWRLIVYLLIFITVLTFLAYFYFQNTKIRNSEFFSNIVIIQTTEGVGSGFFVSWNKVLTAAHVVKDVGNQVTIISPNGNNYKGIVKASDYQELKKFIVEGESGLKVTDVSEATKFDWALIETNSENTGYLNIGVTSSVRQTDDVLLAGYPLGSKELVTPKGNITTVDNYRLTVNQQIDPGFSGSPLLIFSGNHYTTIGIVVSSPIYMKSIGATAVSLDWVKERCAQLGFTLQ